jgi:hypothetical protein
MPIKPAKKVSAKDLSKGRRKSIGTSSMGAGEQITDIFGTMI